jgi:hypothetical protein
MTVTNESAVDTSSSLLNVNGGNSGNLHEDNGDVVDLTACYLEYYTVQHQQQQQRAVTTRGKGPVRVFYSLPFLTHTSSSDYRSFKRLSFLQAIIVHSSDYQHHHKW